MGSVGLVLLAASFLVVGGLLGLITMAVLAKSRVERLTAFGWGAALGPAGLAIAFAIAARESRLAKQEVVEGVPW